MTYELFQQGPETYIPVIIASLAFTVIGYAAFPFIFARIRKKTITKKKYRTLCYIFNLLVMFFFIIENGESSGAPYFLWTWVFSAAGIKELERRGILENTHMVNYNQIMEYNRNINDEADTIEEVAIQMEEYNATSIRFCRKCGFEMIEGSEFCSQCGTKIVPSMNDDGILDS